MDSIIFDLDGTLWDSRRSVSDAWAHVLRTHYPQLSIPTAEEFGKQMGKLLPDIGRSLFPTLSEEENLELVNRCCEYENAYLSGHGGILFDGLEEALAALSQKYRLFIVSNCQSGYIEAFFESSGLERYFSGRLCNGDTGKLKADNIRIISEKYGLHSPVYVGDTALDGISAHQAGVPFIWAAYGFGTSDDFDTKLDSIKELPGVCEVL